MEPVPLKRVAGADPGPGFSANDPVARSTQQKVNDLKRRNR